MKFYIVSMKFYPVSLKFYLVSLMFYLVSLKFYIVSLKFYPVSLKFYPVSLMTYPVSLMIYLVSLMFYLVSLKFYLVSLMFYLVSLKFYLVSLKFYIVSLKFYIVSLKFYIVSLKFYIVSLKFYTFLPTCGELLDPFVIESVRPCHGPTAHELLYFVVALKSMPAQCLRQWPKQMIIAGGQIWAVGGKFQGFPVEFLQFIPSQNGCVRPGIVVEQNHISDWLTAPFVLVCGFHVVQKLDSSTQHSQYDVREGIRRAISLSSPKKIGCENFSS